MLSGVLHRSPLCVCITIFRRLEAVQQEEADCIGGREGNFLAWFFHRATSSELCDIIQNCPLEFNPSSLARLSCGPTEKYGMRTLGTVLFQSSRFFQGLDQTDGPQSGVARVCIAQIIANEWVES